MLVTPTGQAASSRNFTEYWWGNFDFTPGYVEPLLSTIFYYSFHLNFAFKRPSSSASKYRKSAHHDPTGVFVANADSSLVLATSGTISSEFHDLGDAGWLISSYTLAMCAAQSLVSLQGPQSSKKPRY